MKDLFEFYEDQPQELKIICDSWQDRIEDGLSYEQCKEFLNEVEAIGYTFSYYLDAEPYNLRPIKFARKCDASGEGMNEGYCFGDGEKYFKHEKDAKAYAKSIGFKDLEEAYNSEAYYHTEWHHTLEEEDNYFDLKGNEYNSDGELISPFNSDTKTLFLNYEFSLTTSEDEAMYLVRYSYDFSFDSRGILHIENHVLSEEITFRSSFVLPRIYGFMIANQEFKTSIGDFTFDDDFVESFKDKDNFNEEQILALLEVSIELDNAYQFKQTKKEFLNK